MKKIILLFIILSMSNCLSQEKEEEKEMPKRNEHFLDRMGDVVYSRHRLRSLQRANIPPDGGTPELETIYHIVFSGQSLAMGADAQPALTLTQPYENLTFRGGVRSDFDELDELIPLVESDAGPDPGGSTRGGETACSTTANVLTELTGYRILCSTVGHGGYTIAQLSEGSEWYAMLEAHIQAGYDLVSAMEGYEYKVLAIGWMQGESDQYPTSSTTREEYKEALINYRTSVKNTVANITGESYDIPLFSYQLSSYAVANPDPKISYAVGDAAREDVGIFLVSSLYPFIHGGFVVPVHLINREQIHYGHYAARAIYSKLTTGDWETVRPLSSNVNGQVITLNFNVPVPPLVLDTSGWTTTDMGFLVKDDSGTLNITNVEVVNETSVEIIVDRVLSTNAVVRYASDYLSPGIAIYLGANGNLRDSSPDEYELNSIIYHLYNWAEHFEWNL